MVKTEKEIKEAIKDIQGFIKTEVYRVLQTEEGKIFWLDRLNVLRWVLDE